MRVLVAPLNWGLGHASRCIPLIRRFLSEGNEVAVGGDGDSLLLLRRTFPTLRAVSLAPLFLSYSRSNSQVGAMLRNLPRLIRHTRQDRQLLRQLLRQETFDLVVSDNRFGLWRTPESPHTRHIYITHQLHSPLPRLWHWAEPAATALHRWFYSRYDEIWVPDNEDESRRLSGRLSTPPQRLSPPVRYIGPLSRFQDFAPPATQEKHVYDIVAVLSGPEPQRTLLEEDIVNEYRDSDMTVLIVRGRLREPFVRSRYRRITLVPYLYDAQLAPLLLSARTIIARSGYSTLMDLAALGVLHKARLIPTPGQPEQEYLARHISTSRYVQPPPVL